MHPSDRPIVPFSIDRGINVNFSDFVHANSDWIGDWVTDISISDTMNKALIGGGGGGVGGGGGMSFG